MLKKSPLFFLFIWIFIITFLSLMDLSSIDLKLKTESWIKIDKIIHFVFYFTLTALLTNYFKNKVKYYIIYSIFAAVIFGIIIEILQDIVPTKRSFDYFDILANTLGSIVVIMFMKKNKRNKKKILN